MANLMQNMLTLQTEHKIPMRMDLNTSSLIKYYENAREFDSPAISDLKRKEVQEYAAYIEAMKKEDTNSQWYE